MPSRSRAVTPIGPLLIWVLLTLGCPGADSPGPANLGSRPGSSGPVTLAPGMCMPLPGAAELGRCTQPQIAAYVECFYDDCDAGLRKCYGTNYRAGTYDGLCGELIECAIDCCGDASCASGCVGSSACNDCVLGLNCGLDCLPSCAVAPVAKTCADLRACCSRIPADNAYRRLCSTFADTFSDLGKTLADQSCNAQYPTFAHYCD